MAVLGHVLVSTLHQHPVEWVDGASACVTLHEAAWDQPITIGKREAHAAETFFHRLTATVRAV